MACSGVISHWWNRSKSCSSLAISAASARPEASSSEVCLAMASAAATVSRIASGPVAEVLAEPLRWPTYKVMPKPWSRLNSTVSTSRWRTEVDSPCSRDTATSQALAPWRLASARICSTCSCRTGNACGPTLCAELMAFSTRFLYLKAAFGQGLRATGPDKRPPTGYHGGVSLRTATMVDSYDDSLDGEKSKTQVKREL